MYIQDKPKEVAPEGTHTAVLYSIVDLGTQKSDYNGEVKIQHRIRFDWELSDEKMQDGRPFAIGREYTASLHSKAELAKMIKAWVGVDPSGGFDASTLLGKACNVSIMHNDKGYANITAIAPLKKNEKAPPPVNPLREFDLNNYKQAVFDSLPDFLKEKIKLSPEYIELMNPTKHEELPAHVTDVPEGFDDKEIPF